ncbi:hypothetical protein EVAR_31770_1 [Eumeta japonica]|uniref:Uncharacterized protein n=1 Tax=Eumeta variegata TaxID=151549 RepID=A0A4C1W6V4_EUMVA|nr:hypothetical protein EVAR_31770_1 [Eumeta japonica]
MYTTKEKLAKSVESFPNQASPYVWQLNFVCIEVVGPADVVLSFIYYAIIKRGCHSAELVAVVTTETFVFRDTQWRSSSISVDSSRPYPNERYIAERDGSVSFNTHKIKCSARLRKFSLIHKNTLEHEFVHRSTYKLGSLAPGPARPLVSLSAPVRTDNSGRVRAGRGAGAGAQPESALLFIVLSAICQRPAQIRPPLMRL